MHGLTCRLHLTWFVVYLARSERSSTCHPILGQNNRRKDLRVFFFFELCSLELCYTRRSDDGDAIATSGPRRLTMARNASATSGVCAPVVRTSIMKDVSRPLCWRFVISALSGFVRPHDIQGPVADTGDSQQG